MVDFKALETLVWVASLKSFHRAAAKLNTTQPAVSQRIAQLEAEIGTRLLERERRAIAPTEVGRRVIDYAERLLKLRAEMLHSVADRSAIRGTLRLGVAETIVHTWLSRFVERMAKAYPALVLEIEVDISPNLFERLNAQEIDLAFVLGHIGRAAVHLAAALHLHARLLCQRCPRTSRRPGPAQRACGPPDPDLLAQYPALPGGA